MKTKRSIRERLDAAPWHLPRVVGPMAVLTLVAAALLAVAMSDRIAAAFTDRDGNSATLTPRSPILIDGVNGAPSVLGEVTVAGTDPTAPATTVQTATSSPGPAPTAAGGPGAAPPTTTRGTSAATATTGSAPTTAVSVVTTTPTTPTTSTTSPLPPTTTTSTPTPTTTIAPGGLDLCALPLVGLLCN